MFAIDSSRSAQTICTLCNIHMNLSVWQLDVYPADPALRGVGFSGATNPVSSMPGLPFQMQRQTPGGTVQYQLSNGRLIPNFSLQQQLGPSMAPGSPTVRPSISHLFHAQNQLSQQSRPPVRPNQQTLLHPSAQLPAQTGLSQSSNRTGAGYMPGSRRAARLDECIVYPLKPGQHLSVTSQCAMIPDHSLQATDTANTACFAVLHVACWFQNSCEMTFSVFCPWLTAHQLNFAGNASQL